MVSSPWATQWPTTEPGKRARDGLSQPFQRLVHRQPAQRSIVPVRRIFFCNSSTPYSSASAVGGQPGT